MPSSLGSWRAAGPRGIAQTMEPERAYAAIMFDLDGTLVDTMQGFADLAAQVMVAHHGAELAEARTRYLETSGIPFCKQLEAIYPGHPANPPASDEFEQRKLAIAHATDMDLDTVVALIALRAAGHKLIVSSNTGQPVVDEFVSRCEFPFDLALGFDPAQQLAKGEPHVARVCRELGIERTRVLFVGDSLKDGDLADASSVDFIGRLGTFGPDDFLRRDPRARTIGHVIELPRLLAAMAAGR